MIYLITYDLNKKGQDYSELYKAIKELGDNIHPMDSVWFVESDNSAEEINKLLCDTVDENDLIFVSKMISNYAGQLNDTDIDWIKKKISTSIYD